MVSGVGRGILWNWEEFWSPLAAYLVRCDLFDCLRFAPHQSFRPSSACEVVSPRRTLTVLVPPLAVLGASLRLVFRRWGCMDTVFGGGVTSSAGVGAPSLPSALFCTMWLATSHRGPHLLTVSPGIASSGAASTLPTHWRCSAADGDAQLASAVRLSLTRTRCCFGASRRESLSLRGPGAARFASATDEPWFSLWLTTLRSLRRPSTTVELQRRFPAQLVVEEVAYFVPACLASSLSPLDIVIIGSTPRRRLTGPSRTRCRSLALPSFGVLSIALPPSMARVPCRRSLPLPTHWRALLPLSANGSVVFARRPAPRRRKASLGRVAHVVEDSSSVARLWSRSTFTATSGWSCSTLVATWFWHGAWRLGYAGRPPGVSSHVVEVLSSVVRCGLVRESLRAPTVDGIAPRHGHANDQAAAQLRSRALRALLRKIFTFCQDGRSMVKFLVLATCSDTAHHPSHHFHGSPLVARRGGCFALLLVAHAAPFFFRSSRHLWPLLSS